MSSKNGPARGAVVGREHTESDDESGATLQSAVLIIRAPILKKHSLHEAEVRIEKLEGRFAALSVIAQMMVSAYTSGNPVRRENVLRFLDDEYESISMAYRESQMPHAEGLFQMEIEAIKQLVRGEADSHGG